MKLGTIIKYETEDQFTRFAGIGLDLFLVKNLEVLLVKAEVPNKDKSKTQGETPSEDQVW